MPNARGFGAVEDTLAGVAFPINVGEFCAGFAPKSLVIINDDGTGTYECDLDGTEFTVGPGEQQEVVGLEGVSGLTLTGTGAFRVRFSASATAAPSIGIFGRGGLIVTADLADGVLSANAAGRLKMAASYFGAAVVASQAHFENDFFDNTFIQAKFKADAFGDDADSRAAFKDGFFKAATAKSLATFDTAFWTASDTARGKFATGFFTANAATRLLFAGGAFDNTFVQQVFAADAFGADAASRAAFIAGFFDATTVLDLFAALSIPESRLADGLISLRKVAVIAAVPVDEADSGHVALLANFLSGWLPITPTAARALTTPTAAAIVGGIAGAQVGTYWDILLNVKGAFTVTLTAGAGVALNGSGAVGSAVGGAQAQRFRVRLDDIGGGTEAVTIFRG